MVGGGEGGERSGNGFEDVEKRRGEGGEIYGVGGDESEEEVVVVEEKEVVLVLWWW